MPFLLSISLITSSVLAYEILLMRLLSIVQWHHFAYMIISVALLGYGASGTFLTIARKALLRNFFAAYAINAALFGIFSIAGFVLAERVPFNPLEIVWDWRQLVYLLIIYLLFAVPFFCAANCVGLAFANFRDRISRIYLFDLVGAGLGAIGVVLALFILFPTSCLRLVGALPFFAIALAAVDRSFGRPRWQPLALAAVGILVAIPWPKGLIELRLSEYKDLSTALRVPGAGIIDEMSGPMGLVDVVESPQMPFRYAPGLSLMSRNEPPEQLGVFSDGDFVSTITRFDGDFDAVGYLDEISSALPYHILRHPDVLVLGAGGGSDVLQALAHGAKRIDAVELNGQVADLVRKAYADFSGGVFSAKGVVLHVGEAREFVAASREKYDLIVLSLMDSFAVQAAGLHALSESYLYTVEALQKYIGHLKPGGLLAITRWLNLPPRDTIKIFATAARALEKSGVADPERRLALVRSFRTATLLVKNGEITHDEAAAIRRFCEKRAFDVDYFPGIDERETNQFNRLDRPYLYEGALALLGRDREGFIKSYKFNIAPATDDGPYFFRFFRWRSLPELLKLREIGGAPLIEWGYPILVATLLQAIAASAVLIVLPLFVFAVRGEPVEPRTVRGTKFPFALSLSKCEHLNLRGAVFVYFMALGLAFLFIEIAFIQRFILFLSHPLYAIAVVLASFLIFAGIGSGFSARLASRLGVDSDSGRKKAVAVAVGAITCIAILYMIALPPFFRWFLHLPDVGRIAVSVILIAPLAFFMGIPFPLGLAQTGDVNPDLIPWAWGINGCASVISPVLATLLAIHFGFTVVITLAVAFYLIAALSMRRIVP